MKTWKNIALWPIVMVFVLLTAFLKYELADARHKGCCYGPDDFDLRPGQTYVVGVSPAPPLKLYPRWKYTTLGKVLPAPSEGLGRLLEMLGPILAGSLVFVAFRTVGWRVLAAVFGVAVTLAGFAVPIFVDWGVTY
ncbi:hypothetical protein [Dongia sp.]|uniref:hypothetical protein n=1 Tax=Dongia sp. TaxID=1977262 RepID=UPI0037524C2A